MKILVFTFGIGGLVLFGSGVLVGREFPRRHFQKLQEGSPYLLDTSTGKLCEIVIFDPTPQKPDAATQYFSNLSPHSKTKTPVCDPE